MLHAANVYNDWLCPLILGPVVGPNVRWAPFVEELTSRSSPLQINSTKKRKEPEKTNPCDTSGDANQKPIQAQQRRPNWYFTVFSLFNLSSSLSNPCHSKCAGDSSTHSNSAAKSHVRRVSFRYMILFLRFSLFLGLDLFLRMRWVLNFLIGSLAKASKEGVGKLRHRAKSRSGRKECRPSDETVSSSLTTDY